MDSIVWNIAAFLSPPQFSGLSLSSSWGENSLLQVLPGRTAGLLLVGMGWLGYSMMATVSLRYCRSCCGVGMVAIRQVGSHWARSRCPQCKRSKTLVRLPNKFKRLQRHLSCCSRLDSFPNRPPMATYVVDFAGCE